jgi:hypothetical protein
MVNVARQMLGIVRTRRDLRARPCVACVCLVTGAAWVVERPVLERQLRCADASELVKVLCYLALHLVLQNYRSYLL